MGGAAPVVDRAADSPRARRRGQLSVGRSLDRHGDDEQDAYEHAQQDKQAGDLDDAPHGH